MSEPKSERMARWIVFLMLAAALIAGGAWIVVAATAEPEGDRCARLQKDQYLALIDPNQPPLRPSDRDWYREHCHQGDPR